MNSIIPRSVTAFYVTGVSPSGKASGFDPDMRGFESLHPSHCYPYLTDSSLHCLTRRNAQEKSSSFDPFENDASRPSSPNSHERKKQSFVCFEKRFFMEMHDVTFIALPVEGSDEGFARLAKSYIHPRLRPEQGTYPCRK